KKKTNGLQRHRFSSSLNTAFNILQLLLQCQVKSGNILEFEWHQSLQRSYKQKPHNIATDKNQQMEGVGSRVGRASSRYGPTTTVFSGPVRKWKKKWVHVPSSSSTSSSSSSVSYHHHHSQSNGQNNNGSSRLLLCRWTPLSPSTPENGGAQVEEPPKRRFRYTPIAVLEEKKKTGIEKVGLEVKAGEKNQFAAWSSSKSDEMNKDKVLKKETQDSTSSHLHLGLSLDSHDGDHSSGQKKESQSKGASSGGFWTMG
ncbi:hypothetical protein CFOL_v3_29303, partial [Cephalotus follicularis]